MKIIAVDNYARETVADRLIAENVPEYYAELFVNYLNERSGQNSAWYFKSAPDDHKLWRGMEELI